MWFGITLIVVGVVFLLDNVGFLSHEAWDIIWPVVIIVIGVFMTLKKPDMREFKAEKKDK